MTLVMLQNLGLAWGAAVAPANDRRIYWQWNSARVGQYYSIAFALITLLV